VVNWTEEQVREAEQRFKGGDVEQGKASNSKTARASVVRTTAGAQKSRMNRWEQEYALELEARKHAGEILWWGFEAIKLRLADGTWYTPDLAVLEWRDIRTKTLGTPIAKCAEMQFIEVKGFLRDDANVKFKVAAELFPWAEFLMYRKKKGGGWELIKHLNGGEK
jgi:hypothetical protein